jgi:hypothetical protein
MNNSTIARGLRVGRVIGSTLWQVIKSEKSLQILKVCATFAAFIHSVEELKKMNRRIGFKKK